MTEMARPAAAAKAAPGAGTGAAGTRSGKPKKGSRMPGKSMRDGLLRGGRPDAAAEFALEVPPPYRLPYRLSVVTNHASRLFSRRYSEVYGFSIPGWRVLAVAGRFGGLSATEVVERTAMDKVKVSRAIRALLLRGLLARQEDATDRRVQRLAMTRAGRALHACIVPEAKALEAELLAVLAPDERQALHRLLDRLEARLQEMGAGADAEGPD